MSQDGDFYSEDNDEVILSPQEPITRRDIRELIQNWEDKFEMTEGMRAHLDTVTRESRSRESALTATNKQLDAIKEALARFMKAYDPTCPTTVSTRVQSCAPTVITQDQARQTPARMPTQPRAPIMSTPITPPGAPRISLSLWYRPHQQKPCAQTERKPEWKPCAQTDMRGRDTNERPAHHSGIGMTMNTSSGLNTVFHEYLAGIIFSEFVILEISRVFNLVIPKNLAG